jgi:hypothetical protein
VERKDDRNGMEGNGDKWNGMTVKGREGWGMEMKEGREEEDERGKRSIEGDEMIILDMK